jgi:hypothetical protein
VPSPSRSGSDAVAAAPDAQFIREKHGMGKHRKRRTPGAARRAKLVGQALDWSAAEVDRLATVTPEDVAAARATFRLPAPKRARRLLDG